MEARLSERVRLGGSRKLLLTMLHAVWVEPKENAIVAIKPKAPPQARVRDRGDEGRGRK